MIKDVEDLEVYNRSMKLIKPIYRLAGLLPSNEFRLKDQLTGAAKSVPALITEGFAKRRYEKEFKRFLKIAIGSSDEVITHLRMIAIVTPRLSLEAKQLAERYKVLSKRINSLHTHWQSGGTFRLSDTQVN